MGIFLTVFICLFYLLTALLPVGAIISSHCSFSFQLFSTPGFALLLAALGIFLVVLDLCSKFKIKNMFLSLFLATLMPLAVINAMFFGGSCDQLFFSILDLLYDRQFFFISIQAVPLGQPLTVLSVLVHLICCCILTVKHVKPLALKILSPSLSALMVLPIGYILFFALLIGNFGNETVIKTIESPGGTYCAQVIDSNQGALGGNTNVEVQETWKIDALLFKVQKQPRRVYSGDWMEYETMDIYWKDDGCLVINSVEYPIE